MPWFESNDGILFPSQVSPNLGWFDRFAARMARLVAKSWFFSLCILLVLIWAPSYFLIRNIDTWQLVVNTGTTIITFLMVSLLQNTQTRDTHALQHKLNAQSRAMESVLSVLYVQIESTDAELAAKLRRDILELRSAVGLENRESS